VSSIVVSGDTSGSITLAVPAVAGTNTITFPALTGTIITTASTSGIPNTINWTTVQTASVNPAVAFTGYPMNTTSGALTVTLPASPTAGSTISILDYAGTAATNNITVSGNGNKIQGTTTSATISTNREAINLVYVDATQGWLAYADVYSTTSPLPQTYTASYLLVAGGGGAGADLAGGGGAGGLVTGTTSLNIGTIYTAVVGGGGSGGTGRPSSGQTNGTDSSFTGVTTAVGGGRSVGYTPGASTAIGANGGSGGGGSASDSGASPGGSGTPGQGSAGGAGLSAVTYSGGGGGGSSAVGVAGAPGVPGAGGAGTASSITGTPATYAGGGGGGAYSVYTTTGGAGGTGGGGTGGSAPSYVGSSGTVNTGGGAGGGGYSGGVFNGGAGGSGVVILSVPTANYSGTTTGSPTITTSGANTIIKYTSGSGTYTA